MSDTAGKTGAGGAAASAGAGATVEEVTNALKLEQGKNQVLLNEVIALEDEIVNRTMADFDKVIDEGNREFWREQLVSNRAGAMAALEELAEAKRGAGDGATRRPMHNRATARPVPPAVAGGTGAGGGAGGGAVDVRAVQIRNRAHEIAKAEGLAFSTAFRRAERELAEK